MLVEGKTSPKAAARGMCKRPHDVHLVQATASQPKAQGVNFLPIN